VNPGEDSGLEERMHSSSTEPRQPAPADLDSQHSAPGAQEHREPGLFSWDIVEITKSPNLARLIGALTIECSDIPFLDLSQSTDRNSDESENDIDLLGFLDKFENFGDAVSDPNTSNKALMQPCNRWVGGCPKSAGAFQMTVHSTWNGKGPSSLNEIWPFPQKTQPSIVSTPRAPQLSCNALKRLEWECKAKFRLLGSMTTADILKLVRSMWTVADRYYDQCEFTAAEPWYRRIVTAKQKVPGIRPQDTLEAALWVVEAVFSQGKYFEAEHLHQQMHSKIQSIIKPESPIAYLSNHNSACLLHYFGRYEEEEVIRREMLQIQLTEFGTRHENTVIILRSMGNCLRMQNKYQQSEHLLRIALDFNLGIMQHLEQTPIDRRNGMLALVNLSKVLHSSGRHAEAGNVLENGEQLFSDVLQMHNLGSVYFHIERAKNLIFYGRHAESEEVLRSVLKFSKDTHPLNWRNAASQLADILVETNRLEEAAILYEKIFHQRFELYGPSHKSTRYSCMNLGWLYQQLGRHDDAIDHFQRVIEKLTQKSGLADDTITSWIHKLRGIVAWHRMQAEGG